jgi:hypothetical protein
MTIKLPKKAIYPRYQYGVFEYSKSEKNYENEIDERIQLPKWMSDAIEEYAKNEADLAVNNRLREIRKILEFSN